MRKLIILIQEKTTKTGVTFNSFSTRNSKGTYVQVKFKRDLATLEAQHVVSKKNSYALIESDDYSLVTGTYFNETKQREEIQNTLWVNNFISIADDIAKSEIIEYIKTNNNIQKKKADDFFDGVGDIDYEDLPF